MGYDITIRCGQRGGAILNASPSTDEAVLRKHADKVAAARAQTTTTAQGREAAK